MARRPDIKRQEEFMSREDLEALGRSLALLSPSAVRDFYERANQRCRISDRDFPSARALQELVQAWKLLRKWRRADRGPRSVFGDCVVRPPPQWRANLTTVYEHRSGRTRCGAFWRICAEIIRRSSATRDSIREFYCPVPKLGFIGQKSRSAQRGSGKWLRCSSECVAQLGSGLPQAMQGTVRPGCNESSLLHHGSAPAAAERSAEPKAKTVEVVG